jgi:ring-1,2-phenylacetyl-CoA epoxidase subunit PaaC
MAEIQAKWMATVTSVLQEATLEIPKNNWKFDGGREGRHSEHMGYLLSDLQYMQRAYPNMEW